ncbi:NAD(P)/FAD-dependent oxidoreductase [Nostoc sp. FACHB-110]|uniref:dihydrolipoyl dehydrogenase family protein n=1 Tax=Nostoc sp. FACHB-110 TaxID=2692834 RepID=UPI0016889394|nr:NAD(P)/FAD-dependent oxidoreductase [Nostoc sp. FACHB-110]MBD2440865.1 NAD(P)/FAD-dependent oxidoreductase [Nostoc sp. FACHB-110]
MTIDYDVVIIGGTLAGRYAALRATKLHAKVALVEPQINYGFVYHQTLSEIAKIFQSFNDAADFGIHTTHADTAEKCQISVAWQKAMQYADEVAENIHEINSPAKLAALGVDVIIGRGEFQPTPHLAFTVYENDSKYSDSSSQNSLLRVLRGRTYLLASGSHPAIPNIDGLQATGYLNLNNIWQLIAKQSIPQNWAILGGVPQSIEIAQTLARLGCTVTLIVKFPHILPNIDPEIAQLLQAQLEVDGVRVLTQTLTTQVRQIDGKKWLQAGDKAIETDEILVATGQQPNFASLNLAAVGVKWHQQRLVVNHKLQTTNPRIYACGDVIGGYDFANIANYEARIALNNALFLPRLNINYQHIPWAIFTRPALAQLGFTEKQASKFYHNEFLVFRHYFKSLASAQIQSDTTGVCKLIVLRNGEIIGATILGTAATELINLIALVIKQKIKVKDLANLAVVYPSFSEILVETAQLWHQQRLNSNLDWQDKLEDFFHFRRNWNL